MESNNTVNQNKTEAPIVRYLHAKATQNEFCASATFEITSRCNFSCKMCYVHSTDCNKCAEGELSLAQWTEIARQAAEAGVMFVLITGGEPMIRPDFAAIYEMLIKMGFVVSLNSNLSLMTEEHLALFKKYPPNRINASLYGVSDETYKNLCGVPAYTKVIKAIAELKAIGVPVKINSSVTPYNCRDFDDVISYCNKNHLPLTTASYMFPAARLTESRERFTAEDAGLYRVLADYRQLEKEEFLNRAVKIESGMEYIESGNCIDPNVKTTGVRCRAGTSSVWIDYKGNMSMCGMVPADEAHSVLKSGFEQCRRAVKVATKAIVLPQKCTDCRYRYICNVCAAACLSETGAFDKVPPYLCRMAENTVKYYQQYANQMKNGEENED